MEQLRWYSLYDRLLHSKALELAFREVKSANGAPGVDGQSCKDFAEGLDENISHLLGELKAKTYQPQPVKRVEIPKPDGGVRKLGVPCVVDRLIQQALLQVLQRRWDPTFSEHSYGLRLCGRHRSRKVFRPSQP